MFGEGVVYNALKFIPRPGVVGITHCAILLRLVGMSAYKYADMSTFTCGKTDFSVAISVVNIFVWSPFAGQAPSKEQVPSHRMHKNRIYFAGQAVSHKMHKNRR